MKNDIIDQTKITEKNRKIREYNEAGERMINSHYTISKDIMLVSGSLFGILVSLTDSSKDSYWARLFFVLSLFLIILGLLLVGVSMLGQFLTDRHRLGLSIWRIRNNMDEKEYDEPSDSSDGPSFYSALKNGLICLFLSLISLLIFIIIRNNILYP